MGANLGTVVITGAAGRVGSAVRVGLRGEAERLVLVDRVGLTAQSSAEEVRQLDLRDAEAVTAALEGADAVVHLGGVPDEASLPDLLDGNVRGTHNVLSRFWDIEAGAALGYAPVDDAEVFALRLPPEEDSAESGLQGGAYASAEYTLRHI